MAPKTPRSKSSRRWLKEHFDDPYVKQAQKEGLRSRAVFKLQEIQEKDRILKRGSTVIDLGAAPGGWSQYAASLIGEDGKVIALDILDMEPLPGVVFLKGDFTEQRVLDELLTKINNVPVSLVMSDMAPNISGMKGVDQPRSMYLAELAVDLAQNVLCKGGDLLIKVFQGEGFEALFATLKQQYERVLTRKPQASRSRSREVYLLARGFRG